MKSFEYIIKDEVGIHARPAGMLAKESKKFESKVVLRAGEKSAEGTKLMAVMGLGIKCGQNVVVEVSGSDEDAAYEALKNFFEINL